MELRQIEFFLQLYKDRNITVASQNLYISQQGMSKSIANLEKEVGFPLFKRSVSGVKPTAEAGELYSYFRTVMKSYAGLQKKVNDIGMRKNGVLSIVWPDFFALACEKEVAWWQTEHINSESIPMMNRRFCLLRLLAV